MMIDIALGIVALVAIGANVVLVYLTREEGERMAETVREVHALLRVWAETWPDPGVRQQLLSAVSPSRTRRKGDRR